MAGSASGHCSNPDPSESEGDQLDVEGSRRLCWGWFVSVGMATGYCVCLYSTAVVTAEDCDLAVC